MPWIGRKKLALVPVFRSNAIPPDALPADWNGDILRRVFFDPDPTTGADRSLRAYIRLASSGMADLDAVVLQVQTITLPVPGGKDFNDVPVSFLDGQTSALQSKGFDAGALVMLGGPGAGTSQRGGFWARFVMLEKLGTWAMEFMHCLTNFADIYSFNGGS